MLKRHFFFKFSVQPFSCDTIFLCVVSVEETPFLSLMYSDNSCMPFILRLFKLKLNKN